MDPTVSILIPYYNDGAYLKASIQSVLDSTYTDFELILLDHASTDEETVKIAHSFSDPRIKHIRMEKNLGAGSGLLLLEFLKHAKGKYVKLFCADDMMLPDGLETLVNFMENNPEKDFAFGNAEYVNENGECLNEDWFCNREGFDIKNNEVDELILYSKGIGHLPYPANICKTDLFKHIQIEKVFMMVYDMMLWCRLLLNGYKIAFINKAVIKYRIHSKQMSSTSHMDKVLHISGFEAIEYCRMFYEIKTVSLLKKIFPTKYTLALSDDEQKFIPFVVAHHYATSSIIPHQTFGRIELYKMMNDDETRTEIENRFNFRIKEFRDIYSSLDIKVETTYNLQNHIFDKKAKKLSILQIIYIFLYKITHWSVLKKSKKKKYTA